MNSKKTFVLCVALNKEELDLCDFTEQAELDTLEDCINLAQQYQDDFYLMYVVAEDGSNVWQKESELYKKKTARKYYYETIRCASML